MSKHNRDQQKESWKKLMFFCGTQKYIVGEINEKEENTVR